MKRRHGFVTNSSSSSFIIGKKEDDYVTIDYVYNLVRSFYIELLEIRDKLIVEIEKHSEYNLKYIHTTDKMNGYFKFKETGKENHKKNDAIRKIILDTCKFDVQGWNHFKYDYDWVKCKTYKEYERYWVLNTDKNKTADFSIVDFIEEKEVLLLHYFSNNKILSEINKVDSTSEILDWYHPDIYDYFASDERESVYIADKYNVPEKQACLYLLGRVAVLSESGYMPDYVVDKLKKVSEFACTHMG